MRLQQEDRHYLGIAMPAALEGLFMVLLSSVDIIMVGVLGTAASDNAWALPGPLS